jgi:transcriptional/translational regulatory protein YebC/TACO1
VLKAKAAQMNNDLIDRAIKRGTGQSSTAVDYEEITYEGYAPGGVAPVDRRAHRQPQPHRRRDALVFEARRFDGRAGRGRLAVQRKGVIVAAGNEDDVMMAALDAGADDVAADGDDFRITCPPSAMCTTSATRSRRPGSR